MSSQFQFNFLIVRIKFLDFEKFYFPASFFYLWMYLVKIRKSTEICKKKVFPLKPVPDIEIEIEKSTQKKGIPILPTHSIFYSLHYIKVWNWLQVLLLNLGINLNNEYRTWGLLVVLQLAQVHKKDNFVNEYIRNNTLIHFAIISPLLIIMIVDMKSNRI